MNRSEEEEEEEKRSIKRRKRRRRRRRMVRSVMTQKWDFVEETTGQRCSIFCLFDSWP